MAAWADVYSYGQIYILKFSLTQSAYSICKGDGIMDCTSWDLEIIPRAATVRLRIILAIAYI
jgi:hypothetical protein